MIARPPLLQRTAQSCLHLQNTARRRHFHPTTSLHANDTGIPNHYRTLDLPPTATPVEIKKQFYRLSKAHHPDLHPDDPHAAERFVQISEAHAVLGSPEKKSRYDRDFHRASQSQSSSGTPSHPSGSYSSASAGHAGSRPASGLSRRRTQFRGPPPSFYRSGGWGEHGEKRGEAASRPSHAHEAQGQQSQGATAGTGPGGFTTGFDNDVNHFDHEGHYRTHSDIERTRHRARRKLHHGVRGVRGEEIEYESGGSMLFNFLMVSGVLVFAFGGSAMAMGVFGARWGMGQGRGGKEDG
ncbi:hypothetical protein BAUCODRAFT_33248 [Baudoinia panamericana UAMH 10762]|uniref:J domain-containing protein n=1 Tax=Baudoinia panamericana (strain UAMH 10762) TaxID=717646 RepID=M2NEZ5_BAUPA|nr:uncharacterized protein BAUCODRAFT_33248 [Baudoinia panamericana UAMH 10762]EMC97530.1 hypothetical protein BAUCODRAFT_33248 [Baudoinia panamericana UAMH 10762]